MLTEEERVERDAEPRNTDERSADACSLSLRSVLARAVLARCASERLLRARAASIEKPKGSVQAPRGRNRRNDSLAEHGEHKAIG